MNDAEDQKRLMYERLSPRRRVFVDRIGYAAWDPFQPPKDPLDLRRDATERTAAELIRDFLRSRDPFGAEREVDGSYLRGVRECALGLVNQDDRFRGIYEFCLWYEGQRRE